MTVIEIPDNQAAALKAKAAAQGLTLQAWLGKLAAESADETPRKPLKTGRGMLAKYGSAEASVVARPVGAVLLCAKVSSTSHQLLAHSQGAEVSRQVIGASRRDNLRQWISFGSGVKLLSMLRSSKSSPMHTRCTYVALGTMFVSAAAIALFGAPKLTVLAAAYYVLVFAGMLFAIAPTPHPIFRKSAPLTDYYAVSNPPSAALLLLFFRFLHAWS